MIVTRGRIINFVLSTILGAVFLWLAFRDVDARELWRAFVQIDVGVLVVFAVLHLIVHWYRSMRYRILLVPLGGIGLADCFMVGSVGGMALMLLPFRLGDLVRPALVKEHTHIGMTSAFAAVAVERIIDGLVTMGLMFGAIFYLQGAIEFPLVVMNAAYISFAVFLGGMVFLVFAYFQRERTMALLHATAGRVFPGLTAKVADLLVKFIDGLKVLPDRRLVAAYLFESIIYWVINALSNSVMLVAVGIDTPYAISAGILLLGLQVIGVMIPGAPAAVGPFEYFSMVGVGLFAPAALTNSAGVVFTTMVHGVLFIVQVGMGLPYFFTGHITFNKILDIGGKES